MGEIPLGRFTVIVGANASGKSNLRDALRFLHGLGRGYSLTEILDEQHGGALAWRGIRGGMREVATYGATRFRIGCEMRQREGQVLHYSIVADVSDATGPQLVAEQAEAESTSALAMLRSMCLLDLDPEAMRQPSPPGQVTLGERGEHLGSMLESLCRDPRVEETLLSWMRALTPMDVMGLAFERPTRLHVLLQLLDQACKRHCVQVVCTTHDAALLTVLDEEARDHALLLYRSETSPYSRVRRLMHLPGIGEILAKQDLGHPHSAGWLEDAAAFSEPDELDALAVELIGRDLRDRRDSRS